MANSSVRLNLAIVDDAALAFDHDRTCFIPPWTSSFGSCEVVNLDDFAAFNSKNVSVFDSVEINAGVDVVLANMPESSGMITVRHHEAFQWQHVLFPILIK